MFVRQPRYLPRRLDRPAATPLAPPWLLGTAKPEVNEYTWEFYNLAENYSEHNDLAASNPAKLHELYPALVD
jgi:hypothetical protein